MLLAALPALLIAGATLCQSAAVVEHSLDGRSFQQIGLIHIEDDVKGNQPVVRGTYERRPFTDNQRQQLEKLVELDRLYLWRVKLDGQPAVLTSIKAACLADNFQAQSPVINIDSAGHIISAQLTVPASLEGTCSSSRALQTLKQLPQEAFLDPKPLEVVVNTPKAVPPVPRFPPLADASANVYAAAGGAAQASQQGQQARPPAAQQQQQQAGDGQHQAGSGEGGETPPPPPDTRTWWQKNWLFVMAGGTMVLNMMMKAAAGDVPQQGQPGRPGGARQAAGPGRR